jgi:hypothetical protein
MPSAVPQRKEKKRRKNLKKMLVTVEIIFRTKR